MQTFDFDMYKLLQGQTVMHHLLEFTASTCIYDKKINKAHKHTITLQVHNTIVPEFC